MSEEKSKNPKPDLRYSLIHVFLGNEPATMPAKDMVRLGIIAMVNSVFYYGLGDSFTDFIGVDRESRFCPVSSLIKAGVRVAEGSDYSYAGYYDPWKGMFAMVNRIVGLSRQVYGPEEWVSIGEALKTYTI